MRLFAEKLFDMSVKYEATASSQSAQKEEWKPLVQLCRVDQLHL